MTAATNERSPFQQRYAWVLLFGLALLYSLSNLTILFIGVDGNEFQASTGLVWSEVARDMPGLAQFIARLIRLLAIQGLGFGFLWMIITWQHYRPGQRWSWYALWVVPVVLAGNAAVFFIYQAAGLGSYYATLAFIALLGLILPYRKFFGA